MEFSWYSFILGFPVASCLSWVGIWAKEKLELMQVARWIKMGRIMHEVKVRERRRSTSESMPTVLGSPPSKVAEGTLPKPNWDF